MCVNYLTVQQTIFFNPFFELLLNKSETQLCVLQEEDKLQDIYIQWWIRLTSKYMLHTMVDKTDK